MNWSGLCKFLSIVLSLFLLNIASLPAGLIQGTAVTTSAGSLLIENLSKGDTICGCNLLTNALFDTAIENVESYNVDGFYVISTSKGIVAACADQLFFDARKKKFIPIAYFKPGDFLLTKDNEELECQAVKYEKKSIVVYDISLPDPHLFFSFDAQVVTHNADPITTIYFAIQAIPPAVEALAAVGSMIIAAHYFEKFTASPESRTNSKEDDLSKIKRSSDQKKDSFWQKIKFWKKKKNSQMILSKLDNQNAQTSPTSTPTNGSSGSNSAPDPEDDPNNPERCKNQKRFLPHKDCQQQFLDEIPTDIDSFKESKIRHFIEGSKSSDHKWELLVPSKNWQEIKKIVKEVMESGKTEFYKKEGFSKVKNIGQRTVRITYYDYNGIRRIGSGWVI